MLLEATVMGVNPDRVSAVVNHVARKGQSPLLAACANGCAAPRVLCRTAPPLALAAVTACRRGPRPSPPRPASPARRHGQVAESLLLNGADPLLLDRRHSTCLTLAAGHCHADCVARLLSGRATYTLRSGATCAIADIPCYDEDGRCAGTLRFSPRLQHGASASTAAAPAAHARAPRHTRLALPGGMPGSICCSAVLA
jgi:ankyrin repeat protein